MSTLLLRLSGPMQSWGTQSRFDVRDTGLEPSKSGVIGLLCAALGRPRHAALADLVALRMGIRVDREGRLARDYHTAGKGGYLKASGEIERKNLIVSTRYYLADALFLVGLEGDLPLLRKLAQALRNPVWPLYLGRKAFVPGEPVWLPDGLRENETLEQALQTYPWLGRSGDLPEQLRVVLDDVQGEIVRTDYPLSFALRQFLPRRVHIKYIESFMSGTPPHSEEE